MVEVVGSLKVEVVRSEVVVVMTKVVVEMVGEEAPRPEEVVVDLPSVQLIRMMDEVGRICYSR
ncbi:hypothetical protein Tco_1325730, partial [Tanacetum coccineum]